jgi:hypothetical protein
MKIFFIKNSIIIVISCIIIIQMISCQPSYYHYYDLINDPYEANNLYGKTNNLKSFNNTLQLKGQQWFSQVGNLQVKGMKI